MTTPSVGDQVYLGTFLVNTHVYGVVTPSDTPDQFSATFEIMGDQGTLMTNALIGPKGDPGQNAFALRLQKDNIDDPANLPTTLRNTDADVGKYWLIDDVDSDGNIIGTSAYIWYGTSWRRMMMGTPGPPGPVPVITPSVTLLDPNGTENTNIDVQGTTFNPFWDLRLKVPLGPTGPPGSALSGAGDVDFLSRTPQAGDILQFNGTKWVAAPVDTVVARPYSVPESAFTSFSGLSQRATIGTFAIPPQPFPWTPIVFGQLGAWGLELSTAPLTIGAEVRLGDPVTGALVGRGFGNSMGEVVILPHFSSPSKPTAALTPTNGVATVPANHTNPATGTLYVNLYNDGVAGVYIFQPTDAQLFVFCTPL
jgi:hypothetical protein